MLTQAHSLDTIGVMGRSVEDLALLADAVGVHDDRDPASLSASRPRLSAMSSEDAPLPPLFAFVKTHAWSHAYPATREAFGELIEHLGAQVHEVAMDNTTERGFAATRLVQRVEMAHHFGPILDRAPDLLSPAVAKLIEYGRGYWGVEYLAAREAREDYYRVVDELFRDYGTILMLPRSGPRPRASPPPAIPCSAGFGPISACRP